jgi:hypothetical protein
VSLRLATRPGPQVCPPRYRLYDAKNHVSMYKYYLLQDLCLSCIIIFLRRENLQRRSVKLESQKWQASAFDHNIHRFVLRYPAQTQESGSSQLRGRSTGNVPVSNWFRWRNSNIGSYHYGSALRYVHRPLTLLTELNPYRHRWNHSTDLLRAPRPDFIYPSFQAFPWTLPGSLCSRTLLSCSEWKIACYVLGFGKGQSFDGQSNRRMSFPSHILLTSLSVMMPMLPPQILLCSGATLSRYLIQVAIHHYFRTTSHSFIKTTWVRTVPFPVFTYFLKVSSELYGEIPLAKGEDDGSIFSSFLKESRLPDELKSVSWENIRDVLQIYKVCPSAYYCCLITVL